MMELIKRISGLFSQRNGVNVGAALYDTPYKSANRNIRSLGTFLPGLWGPITETQKFDRDVIVARSRDAIRNQPLARALVTRKTTNVIGTGLRMQPALDASFLGISPDEAFDIEKTIEKQWEFWAMSPQECDYANTMSFYGLQELIYRSELSSGDVFVNTPFLQRPGGLYGLKLQLIESDRICNENNVMNTDTLIEGIQYNAFGPYRYHVLSSHPGDSFRSDNYVWHKILVFADYTGRRRVLHAHVPFDRPGQNRGIPEISSVIESLKQKTRYSEAELTNAVISGDFSVFVKSDAPGQMGGLGPMAPEPSGGHQAIEGNSTADQEIRIAPGAIIDLKPGESVDFANPGRPNSKYGPYMQEIDKEIGAAQEIPPEIMSLYFQSSFSAARGASLEFWKYVLKERARFATQVTQPAYENWFDEAVARGLIDAPGYSDPRIRAAWTRAKWHGPQRGQIQELQAVNAAAKRIEIGISTIAKEAAELGEDWDSLHRQRAIERRRRIEDGLEFETTTKIDENETGEMDERAEIT